MKNPQQAPVPPSGFQHVIALTHEHGSAGSIPDDALAAVGYYRGNDGTLAPIGHEIKTRTIEDKNANKPFEPFSVLISTNRSPRILDERLQRRVANIDWQIMEIVDSSDPELIKVADNEELDRAKDLNNALPGDHSTRKRGEWLLGRGALYSLTEFYPYLWRGHTEKDVEGKEVTLKPLMNGIEADNATDLWPVETTVKISEAAERRRGKLADITELYNTYDSNLGFFEPLDDKGTVWEDAQHHIHQFIVGAYPNDTREVRDERYDQIEADARKYMDELRAVGVDTKGKLITLMVGELLDRLFPDTRDDSFATEMLGLGGASEVATYLRDLESTFINTAREEFKAAKAYLKTVAFGEEGREAAEVRVRHAKSAMRSIHSQLLPLLEAFERPLLVARRINRLFDDLQDVLYASSAEDRSYTFVSDINPELDADPGKVSGDCTDGKPLPFLDPNNNLYNVKVYRDGESVGNVYLLQVYGQSGRPLVWHLDAIQIPQFIDWSQAAPAILAGFKERAAASGVKRITMNRQKELISNYNYIADAFRALVIEDLDLTSKLAKAIFRAAPPEMSEDTQVEDFDNEELVGDDFSQMQLNHTDGILRLM